MNGHVGLARKGCRKPERKSVRLFWQAWLDRDMGLIGGIAKIVGIVVLVLVGATAYLYFTDYAVEATITEKSSDNNGNYIVVTPKLVQYDVRKDVDAEAAAFVCVGYKVTYAVQSGFTEVFDRKGTPVWDSVNGLNDNAVTNRLITRC